MRRGFIAIVITACASLLLLASGRAQVVPLPANGDFEGGPTGWAPTTGGTLTIDGSQPVNDGGAAGHVLATSAGTVTIRTQYWLTPATPGNKYSMSLSVRIPAATITAVTARIDLVDGSGAALVSNLAAKPGPTAGYVMLNVAQVTAPANTEYALVVISGFATGAGARFSVDDIAITEVVPPPPPAPIVEPVQTADDTVADDSSPPPPARAGSPIRLPTPSAGPKPVPLSTRLVNGTFESNLGSWSVARGRAWTDLEIPGEGSSMVLYAPAAGTVWAEQVIGGIEPGEWYQASALLATRGIVDAGWIRIAWYQVDDATGNAITTDDSFSVTSSDDEAVAAAPRYQVVGTGAVQAPGNAHSAIVRAMLRINYTPASLIVDDVMFGRTSNPNGADASWRTPSATAAAVTPTAAPPSAVIEIAPAVSEPAPAVAGVRPTSPPRAASAPSATPTGLRAENVAAPGLADSQRAFRITQILPDPENPGRDSEYEWVEITNLGVTPASLEGMTLRDNSGSASLPALIVPPGGTLVVTSRLAEVPGATAFRLAQSIGNGLGNAGDRLVLASADGRSVDAFSYGDDVTYLIGVRIPAPGTGRAIQRRFAADGGYREAVIVDRPTPGRSGAPSTARAEAPPVTDLARPPAEASAGGAPATWLVLLSLGAGLLGGVVAQRVIGLRRTK